ncbi:hypothetical protein VNO78_04567 [Psophocarpus tetragonolobus]|uniref:Uncharacterized protein n=1 Tax=Psophocarpus tetragonolobus TaxID=3891 RepID=A0AAN9T2K5_PSOTE
MSSRSWSWRWWYTSSFRWPALDLSYSGWGWNWNVLQWNSSVVDDVLWAFITGLESIALIAMLCYFFLCCGYESVIQRGRSSRVRESQVGMGGRGSQTQMHNGDMGRSHRKENHMTMNEVDDGNVRRSGMATARNEEPTSYVNVVKTPIGFSVKGRRALISDHRWKWKGRCVCQWAIQNLSAWSMGRDMCMEQGPRRA